MLTRFSLLLDPLFRLKWKTLNTADNGCSLLPNDQGIFQTKMSAMVLYRSNRRLAYYREHFLGGGIRGNSNRKDSQSNESSFLFNNAFTNHRLSFYDHIDWLNGDILQQF